MARATRSITYQRCAATSRPCHGQRHAAAAAPGPRLSFCACAACLSPPGPICPCTCAQVSGPDNMLACIARMKEAAQ